MAVTVFVNAWMKRRISRWRTKLVALIQAWNAIDGSSVVFVPLASQASRARCFRGKSGRSVWKVSAPSPS